MSDIGRRLGETFPAFAKGTGELLEEIAAASTLTGFKQDAFLYSEGDSCSGIGFFLSGGVRVFKVSEAGREITLYEIYPGETCILNASCILAGSDYPAIAQALSDGEVLLMPAETFRKVVSTHGEMREFIFNLFSERLATIMELVEEVAFGRMDERLSEYLLEKSGDGLLESTHQVIANDLGTSREVISRLLKDFEKKGMVSLSRNRIEILSI